MKLYYNRKNLKPPEPISRLLFRGNSGTLANSQKIFHHKAHKGHKGEHKMEKRRKK